MNAVTRQYRVKERSSDINVNCDPKSYKAPLQREIVNEGEAVPNPPDRRRQWKTGRRISGVALPLDELSPEGGVIGSWVGMKFEGSCKFGEG